MLPELTSLFGSQDLSEVNESEQQDKSLNKLLDDVWEDLNQLQQKEAPTEFLQHLRMLSNMVISFWQRRVTKYLELTRKPNIERFDFVSGAEIEIEKGETLKMSLRNADPLLFHGYFVVDINRKAFLESQKYEVSEVHVMNLDGRVEPAEISSWDADEAGIQDVSTNSYELKMEGGLISSISRTRQMQDISGLKFTTKLSLDVNLLLK